MPGTFKNTFSMTALKTCDFSFGATQWLSLENALPFKTKLKQKNKENLQGTT